MKPFRMHTSTLKILLFTAWIGIGNLLHARTPPSFLNGANTQIRFSENTGRLASEYAFSCRSNGLGIGFSEKAIDHFLPQENGDALALVRYVFVGSNQHPTIVSEDAYPDPMYYLLDGHRYRELSYKRIRYQNLYPGIDLVFYSVENQMKFDFVLAAGADAGQIQMRIEGAENLALDANGSLHVRHANGELVEMPPYSYQQKDGTVIPSAYVLEGNSLRFRLAQHATDAQRVIDPPRRWAMTYGGANFDYARDVAVHAPTGDVYVAGYTSSTSFPRTGISGSGGLYDAFLLKTDSLGNRLWTLVIGGAGNDFGYGLSLDNQGNAYLCGQASTGFPFTQSNYAGSAGDAFVAKISPQGAVLWNAAYGGPGNDHAESVGVDGNGNVYLAGVGSVVGFPTTIGTYAGNLDDFFVLKLDSNGQRQYAMLYGGAAFDYANDIVVRPDGTHYIVGESGSTNLPVTSVLYAGTGSTKAFVAKFDAMGNRLFAFRYGGTNVERAYTAAWDEANGMLMVGGYTDSPDFPTNKITHPGTGQDVFLLRLHPNGQRRWATRFGGSGNEYARGLTVDAAGGIFFTGETTSNDYPNTISTYASLGSDILLTKIDSAGNMNWSNRYGGGQTDYGSAISVHSPQAFLVGHTQSAGFPTTINTYTGSGTEAVVLNYTDCIGTHAQFTQINACLSDSVRFTSTTLIGTSEITDYWWEFGDGGTSTSENPSHLYASHGSYNVKLRVVNSCGMRDSITQPVEVYPMPTTAFVYQDTCAMDSIHLLSTASVDGQFGSFVNIWHWVYDSTATDTTPAATFFNGNVGTITISLLIATNYGCLDSLQTTVEIEPLPVAAIIVHDVCYPEVTLWTDSSTVVSGAIATRDWLLVDSVLGSNATLTWWPGDTGNYTLGLAVMTAAGCVDSTQASVRVQPKPIAGFAVPAVCFPESSLFSDSASGNGALITQWQWDFGDSATAITAAPSHAYAAAGSYLVTQTVTTAFGCRDTLIDTALVMPKPTANFAADTVCLGETTHFSNLSSISTGNIASQLWTFGNGDSAITTTHDLVYGASGNYNVDLTIESDLGCRDTVAGMALVWALPTFTLQTEAGVLDLCIGDSVLVGVSPDFPAYAWGNGDTTQAVWAHQPGTLIATVTDSNHCASTDSIAVRYHNVPGPMPVIWPLDTMWTCAGDTAVLDAGPGYASYIWNTGDSSQTVLSPNAGDFDVTVTNGFGCIAHSATVHVDYYPGSPAPVITQVGDTLMASAGVAWQWFRDGNPIGPGTTQSWLPTTTATYTVSVTDSNGCVQVAPALQVTVGIADAATFNLQIWPNPVHSGQVLHISGWRGTTAIARLIDLHGRLLDEQAIHGQIGRLELPQLPFGLYILELSTTRAKVIRRVIVTE